MRVIETEGLTKVEQYLHAEMLSLIVPLALGIWRSGRSPAAFPAPRSSSRPCSC
jgi:hypothetical protein